MMQALLTFFALLLITSSAAAQIKIESVNGAQLNADTSQYKFLDYHVTCKKDLELTNVHIRANKNGGGPAVSSGKNCSIVLRDCVIDGDVIANAGNITLERCVVNGDTYVLWANGSGNITVIDSVVNSKGTSVLIHSHATGNVNLIRTTMNGGKTDVRGKGRIIRGDSPPAGLVLPTTTGQRIPREGYTYQPKDLNCKGKGTKTYSNLHFSKNAKMMSGEGCNLVINGCIMDGALTGVIAFGGDITLRNCEIRSEAAALQVTGAGSINVIDSTISSPIDAIQTLPDSTGNVTLTRTKIVEGAVSAKGTGKIVK